MATKTKKERSKPAPPMTKDDVQFIVENIPTMSYADIAIKRGITKNQVNRVRTEVVNELKELAKTDPAKTDAITAYIDTKLTRPEETRVGGNKGQGQAKIAINNVVGNILNNL